MKKFIALILVLAMIAGMLISCGSNTPKEADKNNDVNANAQENQDGAQAAEEITTEKRIEPELPDEKFGGYTFTFLTHLYEGDDWLSSQPLELVSEAETGEPVNDTVFRRNMKLMEKYDFNLKMISFSDERSAMNKAVKAGESLYDAAIMFNNNVPGIVTAGLLTNIANLPYVDLSKPWWDPAVNSMSIDHKNYLMAGDMLILDNEATNCLLFNKDLMANLGKELPYNLVKEGKWTFDKMNETVKDAAADLNGDGMMTVWEDRWGFCVYNDTIHALLVSGGGALAVKDENDIPYINFATEKNLAVLDKVMNLMYNPDYVLNIQAPPKGGRTTSNGAEMCIKGFEEGRILFIWTRMRFVEFFRGMEANFGIIPLPKYDEIQEKYYSVVNPYTGVLLGVPSSADNLERISIILEAMSAESRYTLQPAYYDVVLQRKYVRDDESSEMLDIIFGSTPMGERVYDIGSVYSFGNVFLDFITLAAKQDRNIVSYHDKKLSAMEKAIDKVVNIFQAME